MHRLVSRRDTKPKPACRADMGEHCSFASGEQRAHFSLVETRSIAAEPKNAALDPIPLPGGEPAAQPVPRHFGTCQVGASHDAELPRSEVNEPPYACSSHSHIVGPVRKTGRCTICVQFWVCSRTKRPHLGETGCLRRAVTSLIISSGREQSGELDCRSAAGTGALRRAQSGARDPFLGRLLRASRGGVNQVGKTTAHG
jgi:hypothetical protein